jgi:hypothetical protein
LDFAPCILELLLLFRLESFVHQAIAGFPLKTKDKDVLFRCDNHHGIRKGAALNDRYHGGQEA